MARFWGAIIGRFVVILWLAFLIGVIVDSSGWPTWGAQVAVTGSAAIATTLLLQTVAALGGYISIKSRVKKAKRNG